jgi:hypothetical protein
MSARANPYRDAWTEFFIGTPFRSQPAEKVHGDRSGFL